MARLRKRSQNNRIKLKDISASPPATRYFAMADGGLRDERWWVEVCGGCWEQGSGSGGGWSSGHEARVGSGLGLGLRPKLEWGGLQESNPAQAKLNRALSFWILPLHLHLGRRVAQPNSSIGLSLAARSACCICILHHETRMIPRTMQGSPQGIPRHGHGQRVSSPSHLVCGCNAQMGKSLPAAR